MTVKPKHAHVRITEKEDDFISKNKLSKSDIFRLGLKITKLSIRENLEVISYEDNKGHNQTLILDE